MTRAKLAATVVGALVGFVGVVAAVAGWVLFEYRRHVLKIRSWRR